MSLNLISFLKPRRCPIIPELPSSKSYKRKRYIWFEEKLSYERTTFVEVITQCSCNQEGNKFLPVFWKKNSTNLLEKSCYSFIIYLRGKYLSSYNSTTRELWLSKGFWNTCRVTPGKAVPPEFDNFSLKE